MVFATACSALLATSQDEKEFPLRRLGCFTVVGSPGDWTLVVLEFRVCSLQLYETLTFQCHRHSIPQYLPQRVVTFERSLKRWTRLVGWDVSFCVREHII